MARKRTVTFEDLKGTKHTLTVEGPGKEELHGWAEACHLTFPNLTLCYQSEEGWGVKVDDNGEEAWTNCTIEPPLPIPETFVRYFGHPIEHRHNR